MERRIVKRTTMMLVLMCFALTAALAGVFTLTGGWKTDKPVQAASPIWNGTTGSNNFAGGSGTSGTPYLISTGEQLAYLASVVNNNTGTFNQASKYYKLTDDIMLNNTSNWGNWATSAPTNTWTPIGNNNTNTNASRFLANFDGNGFAVHGIYINNVTAGWQGLFGYINGGSICNLGVEESYIKSAVMYMYTGGVVAYADNSSITNCYNTGTIGVGGSTTGGVVAYASNTSITDCYNTGKMLDGGNNMGGIVGIATNGSTVIDCYNTGQVNAYHGNNAGGVVGDVSSSSSVINCYNTASVWGMDYSGGVVGRIFDSGSVIANCFNTGSVASMNSGGARMGGVAARVANGSTIINCYNTYFLANLPPNVGCVVGEVVSSSVTYCYYLDGGTRPGIGTGTGTTDKFDTSGKIIENNNVYNNQTLLYALNNWISKQGSSASNYTKWYNTPYPTFEVSFNGTGKIADPYLISDKVELSLLTNFINSGDTNYNASTVYYKLANDIYLNDTSDWENWVTAAPANTWIPIGNMINSFQANFDGDRFAIYGVYINTTADYQGLFGCVGNTGNIRNVGVEQSYIKGRNFVGGIAGDNRGSVTNCYNTGVVCGSGDSVGGIGGYNSGSLMNCYNMGEISGLDNVGGIAGFVDGGSSLINCYNIGAIYCDYDAGGIAGYISSGSVTVEYCYYLTDGALAGIGNGTGTVDVFGMDGIITGNNNGYGNKSLLYTLNDWVSDQGTSDCTMWSGKPYPTFDVLEIASASVTVTAPANGVSPNFTAIIDSSDEEIYTVELAWYDDINSKYMSSSDKFIGGRTYYAEVTLTPCYENILTHPITVDINGTAADYASGCYSTSFTASLGTITIAAIPGVTSPVVGATPVTTITETAQYTGTVSWTGSPATFAAGIPYAATITLTPKEGFTLSGVTDGFFTVADSTSSTLVSNIDDVVVITAMFPSAAAVVTAAALTGVTSPVAGAAPSTAISNGTGFTAVLTWNGNPTTFGYSTAYTATITLTVTSGYSFSGAFANTSQIAGFSVNGIVPIWVSNNGTTLVFTVTFPMTDADDSGDNDDNGDDNGDDNDGDNNDDITYTATADSDSWGGTGDYIITIQDTNKANFKDLKINGAALTEGVNYTVADGSVIITIKEAYLKTLAAGSHNIVIEFKDGGLSYATFAVENNENGETTPDGFPIWAIALIAVAGLGVVGVGIWLIARKKKV